MLLNFIQRIPIPGGGTCNNPIKGCSTPAPIDDIMSVSLLFIIAILLIIKHGKESYNNKKR